MYFPFTLDGPKLNQLFILIKRGLSLEPSRFILNKLRLRTRDMVCFFFNVSRFLKSHRKKKKEAKQNTKPTADYTRGINTVYAIFKIYMMHEA